MYSRSPERMLGSTGTMLCTAGLQPGCWALQVQCDVQQVSSQDAGLYRYSVMYRRFPASMLDSTGTVWCTAGLQPGCWALQVQCDVQQRYSQDVGLYSVQEPGMAGVQVQCDICTAGYTAWPHRYIVMYSWDTDRFLNFTLYSYSVMQSRGTAWKLRFIGTVWCTV